ncbi:p47 [Cryptophlebia peltastica nucleopolyhedrovirus]|uniref:p47 n=1 Tax=Cryptophlebia peltastica nucleopolyhedrovirus TaxID=2304025 RepID=A0A346RNP8_9ABAC|nr:p47 [Cryptophlebia peltastica nucleopolyhedrovirus]AXS67695.1 p47 [Cryptophlebia peltastica nucleopolyhedrovirus]
MAGVTMFAIYYKTSTQRLPQCCKYLADPIGNYLLHLQGMPPKTSKHILWESIDVDDENFITLHRKVVVFDMACLRSSKPDQIDQYIDVSRKSLNEHDKNMLKLMARDRWYKGDFDRLHKMLKQNDVADLIAFACNVMWERGYENNYTLGQQLSIRITTKLIQSGLDFKHQNNDDPRKTIGARGWKNDKYFEKFLSSIASISDVIKRHRCAKKYIVLELANDYNENLKELFVNNQFVVIENVYLKNVCAICIDDDKNSMQYLLKFSQLIQDKIINVLFVTDVDHYYKTNNYMFYLYNSLKLYYYCLQNKFVFEKRDSEIIFLLNMIISLEWHNGGHLNSFTLEKSLLYNPLELSTRRLNSIKRSAAQSRVVQNNNEIKIDFIKGKRIKTGTHYSHRIVQL